MPVELKFLLAVLLLVGLAIAGAMKSRKWTRARPPMKRAAARAAHGKRP